MPTKHRSRDCGAPPINSENVVLDVGSAVALAAFQPIVRNARGAVHVNDLPTRGAGGSEGDCLIETRRLRGSGGSQRH
jgi:hypothetical protein